MALLFSQEMKILLLATLALISTACISIEGTFWGGNDGLNVQMAEGGFICIKVHKSWTVPAIYSTLYGLNLLPVCLYAPLIIHSMSRDSQRNFLYAFSALAIWMKESSYSAILKNWVFIMLYESMAAAQWTDSPFARRVNGYVSSTWPDLEPVRDEFVPENYAGMLAERCLLYCIYSLSLHLILKIISTEKKTASEPAQVRSAPVRFVKHKNQSIILSQLDSSKEPDGGPLPATFFDVRHDNDSLESGSHHKRDTCTPIILIIISSSLIF